MASLISLAKLYYKIVCACFLMFAEETMDELDVSVRKKCCRDSELGCERLCETFKNKYFSCFFRACRGKLVTLVVRFPNQGRQVDDIEIWSHTNETIGW